MLINGSRLEVVQVPVEREAFINEYLQNFFALAQVFVQI